MADDKTLIEARAIIRRLLDAAPDLAERQAYEAWLEASHPGGEAYVRALSTAATLADYYAAGWTVLALPPDLATAFADQIATPVVAADLASAISERLRRLEDVERAFNEGYLPPIPGENATIRGRSLGQLRDLIPESDDGPAVAKCECGRESWLPRAASVRTWM